MRKLFPRGLSLVFGVAIVLSALFALVERSIGGAGAADRSVDFAFGWVIPFLAMAVVTQTIGLRSLRDATWPLARLGGSRFSIALGMIASLSIATALTSAVAGLVSAALAQKTGVDGWKDGITTAWIGALTGWAYAALFSFGATLGKRGGGRGILFLLDWVLGGSGVFALVFPRGNALHLLGFSIGIQASAKISSVLLPVLAVAFTFLASLRSRD